MRVLFVPLPWSTHVFPIVPLAWACRLAGDDVRIAVDDGLTGLVTGAGLTPVPLGPGVDFMDDLRRTRDLPHWRGPEQQLTGAMRARPLDRYLGVAEAQIAALSAFAGRWRPDLVVFDPMNFAGPLVAQQCEVPAVRHLWGPDITRLLDWPGMGSTQDTPGDGTPWPQRLTDLYAQWGGKPAADLSVLTVDPCPTSLQLPGHPNRTTIRAVPYNGPGWAPVELLDDPGRPRVLVTWGMVASEVAGDTGFGMPVILDALAPLDIDVVVAASERDAARLGPVPPNVRVLPVPLHTVLPTCAAIVHQGGGGTMLTAAFHGTPQLAVALEPNQRITTAGLAETGAGLVLTEAAGPEPVREAVRSLLADGPVHAGATLLRKEMHDQPAPAAVADMLRRLR